MTFDYRLIFYLAICLLLHLMNSLSPELKFHMYDVLYSSNEN